MDKLYIFNPIDTNIMEGYFDTEYFISGFRNLRPLWRGLGKSHIYYSPTTTSWRLESLYDPRKVRPVIYCSPTTSSWRLESLYDPRKVRPAIYYSPNTTSWRLESLYDPRKVRQSYTTRLSNFAGWNHAKGI